MNDKIKYEIICETNVHICAYAREIHFPLSLSLSSSFYLFCLQLYIKSINIKYSHK